jgi:hypothetical protein
MASTKGEKEDDREDGRVDDGRLLVTTVRAMDETGERWRGMKVLRMTSI